MLGISRPTVIKYLDMGAEEFEQEMMTQRQRKKKPDIYREEIITWIKQYPAMTAAQVYDWLEEKYRNLIFNEPTLRNYVRSIREEYNIPKEPGIRQYEAVEDPPPGKQMQVDFGEKKVVNAEGDVYSWDGRPLSCLMFGSAAWSCRERDRFIGWDKNQRIRGLSNLIANTRFLIFP